MDRVRATGSDTGIIHGVVWKELLTHSDDRGFFREILRSTDDFFREGFGQWSHTVMLHEVVKAWHLHQIQTEYFYVVSGVMRVALHDLRPDSPTYRTTMDFFMGDLLQPPKLVKIPPGVAHGVKTVQGPVHLIYLSSHVYNPEDELRIPHDDPKIGFDWLSGPRIR